MTEFTTWRSLVDGAEISAIPDSEANEKLIHRWVLADDNGSLDVSDFEGDEDGDNNGVSLVEGEYSGGVAGEGDGTDDHILTGTWGDFGQNRDTGFALAYSIDDFTSDDRAEVIGVIDENGDENMQASVSRDNSGDVQFSMQAGGDGIRQETIEGNLVDDGNEHRVVINVTGTSVEDCEIWLDQTELEVNDSRDSGFSDPANFVDDVALFARNFGGSVANHLPGVLDDICVFDSPLTQSEIEGYQNPWD